MRLMQPERGAPGRRAGSNESGEGLGLARRPAEESGLNRQEHWLAGNIPGWTAQSLASALFQSRYLSDEGRLYFNSPDELVPAATNHKENVYEYEPSGVGSCESPTGGCVALISSGTSDRESAFLEATPDGGDVFFLTEANLLPQDTDTAFDIYDARTCTAESPCLTIPRSRGWRLREAETCRPAGPPGAGPRGRRGQRDLLRPRQPAAPPPPGAGAGRQDQQTRRQPLTRAAEARAKR